VSDVLVFVADNKYYVPAADSKAWTELHGLVAVGAYPHALSSTQFCMIKSFVTCADSQY